MERAGAYEPTEEEMKRPLGEILAVREILFYDDALARLGETFPGMKLRRAC